MEGSHGTFHMRSLNGELRFSLQKSQKQKEQKSENGNNWVWYLFLILLLLKVWKNNNVPLNINIRESKEEFDITGNTLICLLVEG